MALTTDWKNLLIDAAIAKQYHWITGDGPSLCIPPVESVLVSGLLIRSVSLLDDAIEEYITSEGIQLPERNPKLHHRLLALEREGRLLVYDDIDTWRRRRNDVGHEVSETYTWEELLTCLSAIYRELHHIGLLKSFPSFEITKTVQRVPPSSPGVTIEQEVRVEVKEGSNVVHTIRWSIRVG